MVIVLGYIGESIAYGFTGLFIGTVIIVLGYTLFVAFLSEHDA